MTLNENIKFIEGHNTAEICNSLFQLLNHKGLNTTQVNKILKDMFNLLRDGGSFKLSFVNGELEKQGWDSEMFDENMFEHVLALLRKEFNYSVDLCALH
jgi:hypothetical protein